MIGKEWLKCYKEALIDLQDESPTNNNSTEWTEFMMRVMRRTGEKIGCHVAGKNINEKKSSGEYLNIDAMFIDLSAYLKWASKDYDPPVLPSVVVELENQYDLNWIIYCLWKVVCVRAKVKVLICYQANREKVEFLRRKLETITKNNKLMENTSAELFVIIGDDSNKRWEDYFTTFEWRNHQLVILKD